MRRLAFVLFFTAIVFVTIFEHAEALGLYQPFGTPSIVRSTFPGVTCPGYGPVTIAPNGFWPPAPYYINPVTVGTKPPPQSRHPSLGLYHSIPDTTLCVTDAGTPFTVLKVKTYGTSKAPRLK